MSRFQVYYDNMKTGDVCGNDLNALCVWIRYNMNVWPK